MHIERMNWKKKTKWKTTVVSVEIGICRFILMISLVAEFRFYFFIEYVIIHFYASFVCFYRYEFNFSMQAIWSRLLPSIAIWNSQNRNYEFH